MVQDVRKLPAYLRSHPMTLDFIMASFPSVDETPLRSLNGYRDTPTADLFRGDLRFQLMKLTNAQLLIEENTPPHSKAYSHHATAHRSALSRGLSSVVIYLNSAEVGCLTSRTRWIHLMSTHTLPCHMDLAIVSNCSTVSRPVAAVLHKPEHIPKHLWVTDMNVENGTLHPTFHITNWTEARSSRQRILHEALRSHRLPTNALVSPHVHELIVRLAVCMKPVVTLGLINSKQLTDAMTTRHIGLRNIRLWYCLHRVFSTIDVSPDSFTVVTHVTQRGVRSPCQHALSEHTVAMARFGFHSTPRDNFDDDWYPLGTPIRLNLSEVKMHANGSLYIPLTEGVLVLVFAESSCEINTPHLRIARLVNRLVPTTFQICRNSMQSDAVVFDDPKNHIHSAMSTSLSHALGYYSSNDKGHRVCAESGPIRTVTTDNNEIVSTQHGHRYLTFDEVALITSPRDQQLHQRGQSMPLLDASREMANMIPAAMLEAIYKSAAKLFSSWPRTPSQLHTVSAHFTATVENIPVASVQVLNEPEHFSLRTSKNARHVRTRPASPRTKRSPSVKSPLPQTSSYFGKANVRPQAKSTTPGCHCRRLSRKNLRMISTESGTCHGSSH